MNLEIIGNVIIGCFIYNILLKSLGAAIIKAVASNEGVQKTTKEVVREEINKGRYTVSKFKTRMEELEKERN